MFFLSQIKVWRMIQEEQAKHLYRTHTLRRFLLALCDHVTQQRLLYWDQEELAQEHHNRSGYPQLPICYSINITNYEGAHLNLISN